MYDPFVCNVVDIVFVRVSSDSLELTYFPAEINLTSQISIPPYNKFASVNVGKNNMTMALSKN